MSCQLLQVDAGKRLSASEAADHPWLGGPDAAAALRAQALAAVKRREREVNADKQKLMGRRRRVVRRVPGT